MYGKYNNHTYKTHSHLTTYKKAYVYKTFVLEFKTINFKKIRFKMKWEMKWNIVNLNTRHRNWERKEIDLIFSPLCVKDLRFFNAENSVSSNFVLFFNKRRIWHNKRHWENLTHLPQRIPFHLALLFTINSCSRSHINEELSK